MRAVTQPQMIAIWLSNQSTASPQLLPSPPTPASTDLPTPGNTLPNSSLATTETMSTPPRYRTQVEWGEELGILDTPDGFWIEPGPRAYVNDTLFGEIKDAVYNFPDYFLDEYLVFKRNEDGNLFMHTHSWLI
ncbi:hypothetical protein M422DRAFT_267615 [Sphaerobolus stellatus SS14]|uniref:Uncharacterized protein n=1 Tax=Sphaerobolus stellatus (strain SS14) TaxID=990650 RepID=A0A0C9U8K2_SPHS4|nr:hypothetical protein M422DRAFT_267615 [Sphaerobolus stellatus SS14]